CGLRGPLFGAFDLASVLGRIARELVEACSGDCEAIGRLLAEFSRGAAGLVERTGEPLQLALKVRDRAIGLRGAVLHGRPKGTRATTGAIHLAVERRACLLRRVHKRSEHSTRVAIQRGSDPYAYSRHLVLSLGVGGAPAAYESKLVGLRTDPLI